MIRILAIGNSFSQDATAYLHDMAACGNMETKVVNLYIGGCSLCTHWDNAANNAANYDYEMNGITTGRMVSIKEALLEGRWDFVTMQQASCDSGIVETYFPHIKHLSGYIKNYSPDAAQLIHQTWAYEIDSIHEGFAKYRNNQIAMYQALTSAYQKASQALNLEMIPCGEVVQALRGLDGFNYANGGGSLCRDGFHLELIYGRYAAAATWYECILNGNILENNYLPPNSDGVADEKLIHLIKQTVHSVCTVKKSR